MFVCSLVMEKFYSARQQCGKPSTHVYELHIKVNDSLFTSVYNQTFVNPIVNMDNSKRVHIDAFKYFTKTVITVCL